jgi:DNA-binding HxlR family transcriptional regulator
MAKSYAQYCPVAHALELVGERWALLVVRELLNGPKRYTDLADALPGIGTNILAGRLRDLEDGGVIQKRQLPPPAAAKVYELTEYGEGLREPLYALARWGARSLGPPTSADSLSPGWLLNAVRATCAVDDRISDRVFELRVDDEVATVAFEEGRPVVEAGPAANADVVIQTDPTTLFCIAAREQSLRDAVDDGAVEITGKRADAELFLASFSFDERKQSDGRAGEAGTASLVGAA